MKSISSAKHIFISYSQRDANDADALRSSLEEHGVRCWIAPRDVPPGGSYAEALLTAIECASCLVLVYSEHANVSPHVLREVERALKFGINIIPVRFDESHVSKSLDYLLATVHWLSAITPPDDAILDAAKRIAACIPEVTDVPAKPHQDTNRRHKRLVLNQREVLLLGIVCLLATGLITIFRMRTQFFGSDNRKQILHDAIVGTIWSYKWEGHQANMGFGKSGQILLIDSLKGCTWSVEGPKQIDIYSRAGMKYNELLFSDDFKSFNAKSNDNIPATGVPVGRLPDSVETR